MSSAAFALPNAMPPAHAQVASHPNLFVSAENSQWNNYFAGPQVVQVIVSDPNISQLNQAYGEPVVTVNGKRLRMAQGTDGNWYGYFADRNQAEFAGKTAPVGGQGLNFGYFCGPTSNVSPLKSGLAYTDTKGFTIARNAFLNGTAAAGAPQSPFQLASVGSLTNDCSAGFATALTSSKTTVENVIRENKTLSTVGSAAGANQGNGFAASAAYQEAWPVIQLYDFSAIPTPVTVDYSAAGGDQVVNLTFDRIPSNLISVTTDRTAYPENAQVFLTMNDPQLNVDPTEEDSWTWGANVTNSTLYYMAFDRNDNPRSDGLVSTATSHMPGSAVGDVAMQNLIGNLTHFNFNHNGQFTFNPTAQTVRVVDFQSNGKQILNATATPETSNSLRGNPAHLRTLSIGINSEPITFIEQGGVDTGVFGNWDGAHISNIVTLTPATEAAIGQSIRGQSSTFDYNEISGSIVGGFAFGSITMTATNGTWASGTRIPVTLTDMDANTNSKITQYLNDYDGNVARIATMKIGTPFSLTSGCPACLTGAIDPGTLVSKISTNGTKGGAGGFTLNLSGATNSTDPDNAIDEQFSNRAAPSFAQATGAHPVTISNTGGVILDTTATMQTLLNTINNPLTGTTTATTRFHGFNFLNYDLRGFTSLNGANGTDPSAVHIYLLYNTNPIFAGATSGKLSFINPITGALEAGTVAISLANSTNMEDFINLNGTVPMGGAHGSFFTPGVVDNGTLVEQRLFGVPTGANVGFMYSFNTTGTTLPTLSNSGGVTVTKNIPMVTDFFSIGIVGDGTNNNQRINNAIYRWELQETSANTGVFGGTTQFLMLNQLNILNPSTYAQLRTINHDVLFVAIQDMLQSEARAPQVTYLDLGADGVNTQVSAQQDIPTHSGTVSFDQRTYKVGDTVTITVNDPDLNTNNDLVVIYTAVKPQGVLHEDPATDTIGAIGLGTYSDGSAIGRLLDVQFGQADLRWTNSNVAGVNPTDFACFGGNNGATPQGFNDGLADTGFSLVETAAGSGIFTGTFEVPDQVCQNGKAVQSNGQNIKVNYVDFRDESGKLVEVSDNAGIRGNTGSVKLDKAVYPVPFGTVGASTGSANFDPTTTGIATGAALNGVFPLHRDLSGSGLLPTTGNFIGTPLVLPAGVVLVHARVNDPDYTLAATGTNFIAVGVWDAHHGPVAFQITRQGQSVLLATAGGPAKIGGHILDLNSTQLPAQNAAAWSKAADIGPMTEISPGAGIFQADLPIELTDGPRGSDCPAVTNWDGTINGGTFSTTEASNANGTSARFYTPHTSTATDPTTGNYCVRQGDVLTVTYFDTSDASGQPQTVTDSATFDLRNGVLQSDKSVYIIGSDMILTLVEPDLNLDSQTAETIPLDLIEWDSHAYKGTMGPLADKVVNGAFEAFDAKPSTFVETGKDTGIFQAVIKIPEQLGTTLLERGEQINLEYTDWGPAGSKTVGANSQDIELTIYTSNFGATVELDQKVYTWTDMVYITVVAPDHNFDPNLIDTIGLTNEDQVIVSTRGNQIFYKLSETGVDTGIFTGYVILTGDPTLKGGTTGSGVDGEGTEPTGLIGTGGPAGSTCTQSVPCGPTDGFLPAEDSDGVSVSFEFTRDQTVTGSALIRWNIGEVSWLQASYPANGQGVLQIVDPDMNLNPKAVDKFDTNVWSDSDSGGIKLTMTETGQDTGIFQGTVYFTTNFQSSGNRLHVSEGDTVTGEYDDRTLPPPYTTADDLRMTATTFIGTVVPPLERAPASNPRIVDSFGNAINGTVKTGQQIQVTADLANGQNTDQPFAYLVQIQDANGVTVSLSWITGTLSAGQSLNPAQSWTPSAAGTYTAQIFVWQSIDNPNALSPPLSTTITVQ
ncbi:MAG: hypothetical protein WBF38_01430 [Nitrosotalea sp.]